VHGWVVRHSTTVPLTLFSGVGSRAKPAWCIALPAIGSFRDPGVVITRPSATIRAAEEACRDLKRRRRLAAGPHAGAHTQSHGCTRAHTHAQTRRIVRARTHARTHRAEHQANSRSAHAAQTLECMRSAPNAPGARYAMHCAIMPPIDAPITAARPAQCAVARALECAGHSHCRLSAALESADAQRQMRAGG